MDARGALVCAGMAVAFAASRTVGLPGFHEQWTSDGGLGLLALLADFVFITIAFPVLSHRKACYGRDGDGDGRGGLLCLKCLGMGVTEAVTVGEGTAVLTAGVLD